MPNVVPTSLRCVCCAIVALLTCTTTVSAQTDSIEHFETAIRPVLAKTCFKCHGGDSTSGELRIDSREALIKGGERGPAIVPGDPDRSLLFQAITHADPNLQMPPDDPLPKPVIAEIREWIKNGATWPEKTPDGPDPFLQSKHWAFQPPTDSQPPEDASGWAVNEVDRFIAAKQKEQSITPGPDTDRRTLVRRAYFDLLGLPPTPTEVQEFIADESPDAWPRLVDRLLDSPHYGERWGRYWMDVVRYADTAGDNADYPIPEIHLYRDYIIDSFNNDRPYDQFVREQIAGDFLAAGGTPGSYADQIVATGYLALARRYATAPYELWHLSLEDAIDTTGRAFLGLTLKCARCHDHKFDPVTQRDYYALYGIFASTKFPYAGSEEFSSKSLDRRDFVPLLPPDQAAKFQQAHAEKLEALNREIARLETEKPEGHGERLKQLRHEHKMLGRSGLPDGLPGAYAVIEGTPQNAPVQLTGDPAETGDVVPRGVIKFLEGPETVAIPESDSGRWQLAEWLTRPEHPLTARVLVNRVWQHHFGKGIVATPSNFGMRGAEPTHPELLDWLTKRFVEGGWSIKQLHRLMMNSRAYRLSSTDDPERSRVDPDNLLYWRFDRRRLDAEAIRDALLAVSGRLDLNRPGEHPFPPIEKWGWSQHNPFRDIYPSNHRSVYLMTQRFQRHPYLALFDGPDTNTTTDQRPSSTVPLQALFWMNSEMLSNEAARFAERLIADSSDPSKRIQQAHQRAFGRAAVAEEITRGLAYVGAFAEQFGNENSSSANAEREIWTSFARTILCANEFIYID